MELTRIAISMIDMASMIVVQMQINVMLSFGWKNFHQFPRCLSSLCFITQMYVDCDRNSNEIAEMIRIAANYWYFKEREHFIRIWQRIS